MIEHRLGTFFNDFNISLRFAEAIFAHPGSCDAVWIPTEYGSPLLQTHREKAQAAASAAAVFRARGITVSLQIANTVGHGEYMKSEDNAAIQAMSLEKLVGHDGTTADYAFCWNGENLRRYTAETVKIYAAALQPDTVWIDDDLRPTNHFPVAVGCFCPSCMRSFNETYGTSFTREGLVRAVNCGAPEWRERWINFTRGKLAEFAALITDSVREAAPGARMALQYGLADGIVGGDEKHIFDALRRKGMRPPASRAGEGTYHDKNPFSLLEKQIFLSFGLARLPEYVRYRVPEIENTPDVVFGKSNYGTVLEGTLALAYGHTGLSFASAMTPYEKFSFHEDLLARFSRVRRYWNDLAACSERTFSGCAGIAAGGYRRAKDDSCGFGYGKIGAMHGTALTRLGLAESFETAHAPFLVLQGETVDTLADEEIVPLFDRPVLTDAPALEKLAARGFAERLPVRVRPAAGDAFSEVLPSGEKWTESFFSCVNMQPYVIEGDCEPFGTLYGKNGEELGISAAVFSVGKVRWAAFGYSLWDDILSSAKRDQIIAAAETISEGLPAYIASYAQVTCIPRVTAEGKTAAVTAVNISIAPTDELKLIVSEPAGNRFIYEKEGERRTLAPVFENGRAVLTLPPFIRGWDAATVFIL